MAIYFIESKYKEIFKLKQMLEKEKIPFDFTCESYPESNFIHYHLEYPSEFDMDGTRVISVVEGIGSYGREADKLEIIGLLTLEEAERDSVAGWLTADDVFRRIKEHYENESQKGKGCNFCNFELEDYPYISAQNEYDCSGAVYEPAFCPLCGKCLKRSE